MGGYEVEDDHLLANLPRTEKGLPRAGSVVIHERLGEGGMGAVYLGFDRNLATEVAVKVLSVRAARDGSAVERFLQEARMTFKMDHPNVVRVLTVSQEAGPAGGAGTYYLVMEFVDGESAKERLRREGPTPERDALEIGVGAGDALVAAHAEGILHRDVKPANILIRYRDGRVKLADLGLAKALARGSWDADDITATGQIMGTPAYMSPEQATDSSSVDERSDIYSLGASLYALMTGKAPFHATELIGLLLKLTKEEPKPLRSLRPEITARTAFIVHRLMAKTPRARPRTMREAGDLLRTCLETAPAENARGLARPEMAGARKIEAASGKLTPGGPPDLTLDDITPEGILGARRAPPVPKEVAPGPLAGARKKIGLVIGIALAVGAALGAWGYFSARNKAEERRREEVARLVAEWSGAEELDLEKAAALFEKAAGLGAEDVEEVRRLKKRMIDLRESARLVEVARERSIGGELEEARSTLGRALALDSRSTRARELLASVEEKIARQASEAEKRAKAASLLRAAASLREAGALDEAKVKAAEALALDAGDPRAKELVASLEKEAALRRADAERRAKVKALLAEAERLRGAGALELARAPVTEALLLDPDSRDGKALLEGIDADIRARDAELEAAVKLGEELDRLLARGRHGEAVALLDEFIDNARFVGARREAGSMKARALRLKEAAARLTAADLERPREQASEAMEAAGELASDPYAARILEGARALWERAEEEAAEENFAGALRLYADCREKASGLAARREEILACAGAAEEARKARSVSSAVAELAAREWGLADDAFAAAEEARRKGKLTEASRGFASARAGFARHLQAAFGDPRLSPEVMARALASCTQEGAATLARMMSPELARTTVSLAPAEASARLLLALAPARRDSILRGLPEEKVPAELAQLHSLLTRGWMELGGDEEPCAYSLAFSPDGRHLAAGCEDGAAITWDVTMGRKLRTFKGYGGRIASVAFSADGRLLATTGAVWDVSSGRMLRILGGHKGQVWAVALSVDGRFLATGGEDCAAALWEGPTGKILGRFEGHEKPVLSVAFSPDGRFLATGSRDGTAALWDVETGGVVSRFTGHRGPVRSIAFSPDGQYLATASWDGTVVLWEAEMERKSASLRGHEGPVLSVAFSPDGVLVATGSADGTAALWGAATAKRLKAYRGHGGNVYSVAFSPDGRLLATASADGTVRVWLVPAELRGKDR